MLRVFFEYSDEDSSIYFKDKAIWECKDVYRSHQGKYPVIIIDEYDTPIQEGYLKDFMHFCKESGLLPG